MATQRITWDPRSEMAERAVSAMDEVTECSPGHPYPPRTSDAVAAAEEAMEAVEPAPGPRQIIILSCGHWDFVLDYIGVPETAYCIRDRRTVRVLQEVQLES